MLPLEKNRVRLDDDSDEDKVSFSKLFSLPLVVMDGSLTFQRRVLLLWCKQYVLTCVYLKLLEEGGLDALIDGAVIVEKEPVPVIVPEEKKPSLSLEELEAKQGTKDQTSLSNTQGMILIHWVWILRNYSLCITVLKHQVFTFRATFKLLFQSLSPCIPFPTKNTQDFQCQELLKASFSQGM